MLGPSGWEEHRAHMMLDFRTDDHGPYRLMLDTLSSPVKNVTDEMQRGRGLAAWRLVRECRTCAAVI